MLILTGWAAALLGQDHSGNPYCVDRSSCPAGLFSFGLLNGPQRVRLRRPLFREAPADFGLGRLATGFLNNPG